MAKLITQTKYVSELTEEMIAEGWKRTEHGKETKMKFNLSHRELKASERSVYSQGGQDGVLEAVFNQIGVEYSSCIEVGARDGFELSNTANLAIAKGFVRVLIDSEPKSAIVENGVITAENANEIIKPSYKLDFLSLDIDGIDLWVWQAIENKPRVVSIEFNSKFKNDESYAIEYNPDHKWEGDDYYGASLLALKKLGEKKGYTLVYVVDRFDAIFIRSDLISPVYMPHTLDELFPEPIIAHEKKSNKRWVIK